MKDSTGNGKKAFIFLYCLHKRLETIRKNQSPRKTECLQEEKLTEIELNDTLNHWKKSNTSDIKFNCFIDCYLQKEGLVRVKFVRIIGIQMKTVDRNTTIF